MFTIVELLPPVHCDRLLEAYRAGGILLLQLNDYDAFKKVLPSKRFEYAALGQPVWAGISGCAAEFVRSEISNAAVFEPGDVEGAIRSLEGPQLEDAPRTAFVARYGRAAITRLPAADVLSVVAQGPPGKESQDG